MNSLFTFYRGTESNDLFSSQVVPGNGSIVALEKQIFARKEDEDDPVAIQSSLSPSAVYFGEDYYLFYKAGSSNKIYTSQSKDCVSWAGDTVIEVEKDGEDVKIQTDKTPASAVFQNSIYLIYKAGEHDSIYLSTSDDGSTWTGDQPLSDIETSRSPSALVNGNTLYLFYTGKSSKFVYSYYTTDGKSWSGNKPITVAGRAIQSSNSPACVVFNGKIYLIYKGGFSNEVYYAYSTDGNTWYGNNKITVGDTTILSSNSPSCAVLNNRLCIIYKAGNTNNIYSAYSENGITWNGNHKVYGIQTGVGPNYLQSTFDAKQFLSNMLTLSPDPQLVQFSSKKKYPYLGDDASHIQGIQTIDLSNANFIISSSNFDADGDSIKGTFKGLIIPIEYNEVATGDVEVVDKLGHAGGIQAHGNTLLVPLSIRDNTDEVPEGALKQLRFYNVDGDVLTETSTTDISGLRDAQAAGFVTLNTDENKRLVFVVVSHSEIKYNVLSKGTKDWNSTTEWLTQGFSKDLYPQAVNLFYDSDSGLYYMVSLRNANISDINRDALGIYTFTVENELTVENFTYLGSMYIDGDNMRRAGGVNIFDTNDVVVSSFNKTISEGENTISIYLNNQCS